MAMYTNIGGTSKELEYLRFNKDGAIQGITDAYANIDANSKKIFGTVYKDYWYKMYEASKFSLVQCAITESPCIDYMMYTSDVGGAYAKYDSTKTNAKFVYSSYCDQQMYIIGVADLNNYFDPYTGKLDSQLFSTVLTYDITGISDSGFLFYKDSDYNERPTDINIIKYTSYAKTDDYITFTSPYIIFVYPEEFSSSYSIVNYNGKIPDDQLSYYFRYRGSYLFDDYGIYSEDIIKAYSYSNIKYEYLGYFA